MNWLKEKWKTVLIVISAIALALLGRKATKIGAKARGKEQMATDLLNSGISKKIVQGKELIESADKDKDMAVAVRAKMQEHLDTIGKTDETLDDIAHRFNSRRLRDDAANSHTELG